VILDALLAFRANANLSFRACEESLREAQSAPADHGICRDTLAWPHLIDQRPMRFAQGFLLRRIAGMRAQCDIRQRGPHQAVTP